MYAALGGHTTVVQRLIEKGSEINEQDDSGYTVGHLWMEEMICEERDLLNESFLNIIDFANILMNTEHSYCLASFGQF